MHTYREVFTQVPRRGEECSTSNHTEPTLHTLGSSSYPFLPLNTIREALLDITDNSNSSVAKKKTGYLD